MRLYILIVLTFIGITFSAGQSRFGLMIGGGALYYTGEMNDRVITHEKLLRGYGNIGVLYRLSNRFDVWANYMHGQLVGADSLAIQYTLRNRNLSFQSDLDEAGINIGFRLLGDNKGRQRKIAPYIFAGVAGYHFKPKAKNEGQWVDLQSIGTEGQYIKEGNYPAPYELYQLSIPAGLGIEFSVSRAFAIRLEAARHFLLTDYLDDVSSYYADSASLAATPHGAIAVQMADNVKEGAYPQQGQERGDVKTKDSYTHIGVSLLWTPVKKGAAHQKKKKKKKHCDAYH
jgi:hypothetical protein